MYVQVRLLKGFDQPLWYKIPDHVSYSNLIGAAVKVSLRNALYFAFVEKCSLEKPNVTFAIKEIISIETIPGDQYYHIFIEQLSHYYQVPKIELIKRIRQFFVQKDAKKEPKKKEEELITHNEKKIILTNEQQNVVDFLTPYIVKNSYKPAVIHGVTGSGKTEIYKKLVEITIEQNKSVLFLLPEVTLAVQFTHILKKELPCAISLFSFHSATSIKEKKMLWQKLIKEESVLIIGVHLPVLLPIARLGLIIIDEEHEIGYQEKKHPKINSKEAAILRSKLCNIPIVLGSATPSIATLYNVKKKGWHFFQIKKRFAGAFPKIKIVPLNDKKQRHNFWITKELEYALKDRLTRKEQSIIFLNRRGYSFFVQCKKCSFVFACLHCSVSLTLHDNDYLICHYCGISKQIPDKCTQCKADKTEFLKKGIGTQQLVAILQKMLPTARIERADLDTTINKKKWQKIVRDFEQGALDILVGTQTITKGYHFPKVTLIGILWADLNLHFPMYNAAEHTLQQLIQVAGRAGRQHSESLVIAQIMMDHKIFEYLNEIDYLKFYQQEIETRFSVGYPPLIRLAEIELKNDDEVILDADAKILAIILNATIKEHQYDIKLLGPALPPVHKIKNIHMRKIYLKTLHFDHLIVLAQAINKTKFKSSIFFTPNPLN